MAAVVVATAAIATLVLWANWGVRDVDPETYTRTGDPREISVSATVGLGDEVVGEVVREDERAVVVTLRVRETSSNKPALGVTVARVITLREPLGQRSVRGGQGHAVLERSSRALQSPNERPRVS